MFSWKSFKNLSSRNSIWVPLSSDQTIIFNNFYPPSRPLSFYMTSFLIPPNKYMASKLTLHKIPLLQPIKLDNHQSPKINSVWCWWSIDNWMAKAGVLHMHACPINHLVLPILQRAYPPHWQLDRQEWLLHSLHDFAQSYRNIQDHLYE